MKKKTQAKPNLKTKFTDDREARMQNAARHPVAQEFERIALDAAALQRRMRKWLRRNDVPEDTPGIVAMSLALSDPKDDLPPDGLEEWLQAMRSMDWCLYRGVEQIITYTRGGTWPKLWDLKLEY